MNYSLIFYVIVQIFALIFLYIGIKNNKPATKKFFITISAFILILVIGLRSLSTGTDTKVYAEAFLRYANNVITTADKNWLSVGYFFLFFIIKNFFFSSYVLFNLLVGTITITFLYKAILDNSKKPVLSLFLFFSTCLYLQCLNQSRQILAIVLVLYSFKFVRESNFKKYFLIIFIAGLVHNSAFIMLPFYFLKNLKINYKTIILYILISVFLLVGETFIYKIIMLTPYGDVYLMRNYMVESQVSSVINLFVRFMLLIFTFFFRKSAMIKDPESNNYLYHMAIWTFLTQIITLRVYIFARITTYLFIFYVIFIPNLLHNITNLKNKKFYTALVIFLFVVYFFVYYHFVSVTSGYDTYNFFWN